MIKLKYADYKGIFHGFNLKEGFWYGVDTETQEFVASSGWEMQGFLAIYYLKNSKWELKWKSIEENDFDVSNIPVINTDDKLSFAEWLEVQGIDWGDYDNNFSELGANEIEEKYDMYLFDGLPKFAR